MWASTKRFIFTGCLGIAAAGAGCSSTPPPEFVLRDAVVTGTTAEGVSVRFEIEATNTGDDPLPLREANYGLDLDGRRVFSGLRSPEATIRRRGSQVFVLPAVIPVGAATPAPTGVLPFRLNGSVSYVTPGALAELLFDSGVRVPTKDFVLSGELDMNRRAAPPVPLPPIR